MEEFLINIAEIVEVESVSPHDVLSSFEMWDSLTILSIIALVDGEYSVSLTNSDVEEAVTVESLYRLVLTKQNV